MAKQPMTRTNKIIAVGSLAALAFLLFGLPTLVGVPDELVPAAECEAVNRRIADIIAVDPEQISSPRPGVMMMPPLYWGSLGETERENLVAGLATKEACLSSGNPATTSVEVRSSVDNRLLGSGTVSNFNEAD